MFIHVKTSENWFISTDKGFRANFDHKYSSVFRENWCSPPPKPVYGGISVMKLWPWKLGHGHQNLINFWSCPIYIGLQIW